MIDRRKFSTRLSLTMLASALPLRQTAEAQERRQCDLVVTTLSWSDNFGARWHNDPVPQDASVLFRATIKNIGDAASPPSQAVKVWLGISGQTVATAYHTGGLAAGQTITLQGSSGPNGDGSWFATSPGKTVVNAIVDIADRIAESNEGNNKAGVTIEVEGPTPFEAAGTTFCYADHETGNFSQWDIVANSGAASNTIATNVARSGKYSAKLTIDTTGGKSAGTRLTFRGTGLPNKRLPDVAFYSIWYYFPQIVTPANSWNVFQWKQAEILSNGTRTTRPVYVVDVDNRSNGKMFFALRKNVGRDGGYKTAGSGRIASAAVDIPVSRWVHLECRYKWAMDGSGEIRGWQDGVEIWNETGHITEFNEPSFLKARNDNRYPREWTVNNYSGKTSPAKQSIYVDDGVIASERVLR